MSIEGIFQIALFLATFLCSLAAGLLFAFAIVVMPGIRSLNDREFIRAFQVMDRIIQNNHPLFMFVWIGSILAMLISVVLGIGWLNGAHRLFIIIAALAYFLGVQLPTIRINIPLNNQLQMLDVDTMNEEELKVARSAFEPNWNRWNSFRTIVASLVSGILIAMSYLSGF
jgi:uncharacterized membrane protein